MADRSSVVANLNTTVEIGIPSTERTVPSTLLTLNGANVSSPSFSSQEVDVSRYGDGFYSAKKRIGVSAEYSISGVYVVSEAAQLLSALGGAGSVNGSEAYLRFTYSDGQVDSFWGLIGNYSENVERADVKRFSCSARANTATSRSYPGAETNKPVAVAQSYTGGQEDDADYTFDITFTDDTLIDVSSINANRIQVTGTSFSKAATLVSTTPTTDSSSVTATFSVVGPFTATTYTITALANAVDDTLGNRSDLTTIGTFDMAVAVSSDTTAPTPQTRTFTDLEDDATDFTFDITITDDVAVDVSTFDPSKVVVSGPTFTRSATLNSANPNSDAASIVFDLTVAGPFTSGETLTVTAQADAVDDTSSNGNASTTIGQIAVVAAGSSGADTDPPEVDPLGGGSFADITTAESVYTANIVITDVGSNVDASTIGSGDFVMSGPNYSQTGTLISINPTTDSPSITAVYEFPGPTAANNGTFEIRSVVNTIADTASTPNLIRNRRAGGFFTCNIT